MQALHDRRGRKFYGCRDQFCVGRDLAKLDAFVTAVILERLRQPDVVEALGESAEDPAVEAARERVAELRLETVYPAERELDVVRALRDAHPYEEPAFDLYQLVEPPEAG